MLENYTKFWEIQDTHRLNFNYKTCAGVMQEYSVTVKYNQWQTVKEGERKGKDDFHRPFYLYAYKSLTFTQCLQ